MIPVPPPFRVLPSSSQLYPKSSIMDLVTFILELDQISWINIASMLLILANSVISTVLLLSDLAL